MGRYQAVYVTGAPASGKSTLIRHLAGLVTPLKTMEYGDRLLWSLRRDHPELTREELRARSADLVTANVVARLDEELADALPTWLMTTHVVISSHAVTHERYGVRVTPYSQRVLERLPLAAIVVLHAPSTELLRRSTQAPEGRSWHTAEQADRLQRLQTDVALQYGMVCGCPVFVIDTCDDPLTLAQQAYGILGEAEIFR